MTKIVLLNNTKDARTRLRTLSTHCLPPSGVNKTPHGSQGAQWGPQTYRIHIC